MAKLPQFNSSADHTTHAVSSASSAVRTCLGLAALVVAAWPALGSAQNYAVTPGQRSTAEQVASSGVALSELNPKAPERYTVKSGDTLWGISSLFLTSPWRWPELWGMNITEIRNPHRIYPGQVLVLDKSSGRAVLRVAGAAGAGASEPGATIKVSPRTRYESLADSAIPSLSVKDIEPFLARPLVVSAGDLNLAARIVATQEGRVLLSKDDRAYARREGNPLKMGSEQANQLRIIRNPTPLNDPDNGKTLAYEAEYVGRAELVRGESIRESVGKDGKTTQEPVPATFDVIQSLQEARVGDRLVAEPDREFLSFVPRAPEGRVAGRIIKVYGSDVLMASTNQVLVLNRGKADGLERGHVLAMLRDGDSITDKTLEGRRESIKLPDERSGLLMVFQSFDNVSYALVLSSTDALRIGDRFSNPR